MLPKQTFKSLKARPASSRIAAIRPLTASQLIRDQIRQERHDAREEPEE